MVAARSFSAMANNRVSMKQKHVRTGSTREEAHMPTTVKRFTSVLCDISSLPSVFGDVGNLLLTSGLGNAYSHMMPVQGSVDVDMEGLVL